MNSRMEVKNKHKYVFTLSSIKYMNLVRKKVKNKHDYMSKYRNVWHSCKKSNLVIDVGKHEFIFGVMTEKYKKNKF